MPVQKTMTATWGEVPLFSQLCYRAYLPWSREDYSLQPMIVLVRYVWRQNCRLSFKPSLIVTRVKSGFWIIWFVKLFILMLQFVKWNIFVHSTFSFREMIQGIYMFNLFVVSWFSCISAQQQRSAMLLGATAIGSVIDRHQEIGTLSIIILNFSLY